MSSFLKLFEGTRPCLELTTGHCVMLDSEASDEGFPTMLVRLGLSSTHEYSATKFDFFLKWCQREIFSKNVKSK